MMYSIHKRQRIVYLFNKESRPESGAVFPCQMVSLIMHELSNALDHCARAGVRRHGLALVLPLSLPLPSSRAFPSSCIINEPLILDRYKL